MSTDDKLPTNLNPTDEPTNDPTTGKPMPEGTIVLEGAVFDLRSWGIDYINAAINALNAEKKRREDAKK